MIMMNFLEPDSADNQEGEATSDPLEPARPEEVSVAVSDVDNRSVRSDATNNESRESLDGRDVEGGGETESTQGSSDWECPVYIPIVSPLVECLVHAWAKLSPSKRLLVMLVAVLVVGVVLLVTLLPASFIYVNYYEIGLSRNKWTGAVDYDNVYDFGCHLLAPQDEVIRLASTAHHRDVVFEVITKESLVVHLQLSLQYTLKRDEVGALYRKYNKFYHPVIDNVIEGTVKNFAVKVSLDQFRQDRKTVEKDLGNKLKYVLSGDCCPDCCTAVCSASPACSACSSAPNCYPGHHVEFRFFQMGRVTIPYTVMDRYLRRILLQIEAERENFIQNRAVVDKETEMAVKQVKNQAKEVLRSAVAHAKLITAKAEADAERRVTLAYKQAMAGVFSRLNITTEEKKVSFMYVKALENMKQNIYSYNYDSYSAVSP